MALNCLVTLTTFSGCSFAEIRVNSLHQLALVMPASVVTYEVRCLSDGGYASINDEELFDLLIKVIQGEEIKTHRA